jgi:hypothetical protein
MDYKNDLTFDELFADIGNKKRNVLQSISY